MDQTSQQELMYADDLHVGDSWLSEWREITGEDVADFAHLTGDHDPLHTDASGASSPFGQPIAHGLMGLSVLAGLSTNYPRVATRAFTGVTDWEFTAPIFFGDKVQVLTEVESLEPHGRRSFRVVWFRKLLNKEGKVLQQGRFITLVSRKAPAREAKTPPEDKTQRGKLPPR